MRESSLQITFRHGRPLAAYYYLPHEDDVRVDRSSRRDAGLVVDFAASGQPAVGEEEFAPLRAA